MQVIKLSLVRILRFCLSTKSNKIVVRGGKNMTLYFQQALCYQIVNVVPGQSFPPCSYHQIVCLVSGYKWGKNVFLWVCGNCDCIWNNFCCLLLSNFSDWCHSNLDLKMINPNFSKVGEISFLTLVTYPKTLEWKAK